MAFMTLDESVGRSVGASRLLCLFKLCSTSTSTYATFFFWRVDETLAISFCASRMLQAMCTQPCRIGLEVVAPADPLPTEFLKLGLGVFGLFKFCLVVPVHVICE